MKSREVKEQGDREFKIIFDRDKLARIISDTYRPYAGSDFFNNYDIADAIISSQGIVTIKCPADK